MIILFHLSLCFSLVDIWPSFLCIFADWTFYHLFPFFSLHMFMFVINFILTLVQKALNNFTLVQMKQKKQPSVPTLTKTLSLSFGSPEVHNTASSLTPTSELIKWALMFTHSDRCFINHPAGGSTGASSITWCWKCLRRSRLKAWWQWRVKSCAVVVNTWGHMRLVLSSS